MTDHTKLPAQAPKPDALDLGDVFKSMIDLAKDPNVDPAKMDALLSMQERMIDRQSNRAFQLAMHAARGQMPRIAKDGKITNKNGQVQSRYAHFEAIDKVVRPIAEAQGLTYGFDVASLDGGRVGVTCIVTHVDGHAESFGPMPLAVDTTGAKNATQGAGSALSYGKRYMLCAAFNIVTDGEDDDASAGRGTQDETQFAALLSGAETAAEHGQYEAFFKSLKSNVEKGWLVDHGHHERLKRVSGQAQGE